MKSERRQRPRKSFDEWVELHTNGVRRLATGFDLSPGGIGVVIDVAPAELPANLVCEFPLPGISLPIELAGAVAWTDGSRIGVRFEEVDPGLAELLENYVAGQL